MRLLELANKNMGFPVKFEFQTNNSLFFSNIWNIFNVTIICALSKI